MRDVTNYECPKCGDVVAAGVDHRCAICNRCGFAPCMCSAGDDPRDEGRRPLSIGEITRLSNEARRDAGGDGPTKVSALGLCLAALEPLDEEDRVRVVDALVALQRIG